MSLRRLHDVYLPPFYAAAKAGADTFMTSFNDLNGVPSTANPYLLRDVLRGRQAGVLGSGQPDHSSHGSRSRSSATVQ